MENRIDRESGGTVSITAEQQRWAEALAVQRLHGDHTPCHVAERIGALALAGDVAGIERWKAIARQLDQLLQVGACQ